MAVNTQERPVVPSDAELAKALEPLRAAAEPMLHVLWHVRGVSQFNGERAPTFEEIGRVFAFVLEAEGRLGEVTDYVKGVRGSLEDLDCVRLLNNVSDDIDPEAADA